MTDGSRKAAAFGDRGRRSRVHGPGSCLALVALSGFWLLGCERQVSDAPEGASQGLTGQTAAPAAPASAASASQGAAGGQPAQEAQPTAQETGDARGERAAGRSSSAEEGGAGQDTAPHARAELRPTRGNTAEGTVEFTQTSDGMLVRARLRGLDWGPHGLHIHETGDCSAPDASSAGGHMAPLDDPHGAPQDPPAEHHAGDLGNVAADSGGTAAKTLEDSELTLAEGEFNVVGRAVIVHSGADDLESQPAGDAGDRVACGVIRLTRDE